jgi:hypothetical protein
MIKRKIILLGSCFLVAGLSLTNANTLFATSSPVSKKIVQKK